MLYATGRALSSLEQWQVALHRLQWIWGVKSISSNVNVWDATLWTKTKTNTEPDFIYICNHGESFMVLTESILFKCAECPYNLYSLSKCKILVKLRLWNIDLTISLFFSSIPALTHDSEVERYLGLDSGLYNVDSLCVSIKMSLGNQVTSKD